MNSTPSARSARRPLILIGCVVFAEPLTSTLLFPFVYFMVRDFTSDQTLIGFRVGLITSAFFLCQLICTPLWGLFSDRYGRRAAFLVGLCGGAISIAAFGVSKSLPAAVVSRSISGLLNGNIGVARTAVAEVAAIYGVKQSKAFSLFGFCGAFGYIAGPLIGGLLSKPAESLGITGPHEIFVSYPYLLPCLVSSVFNLVTMLAVAFGLEETLHRADDTPTPPGDEESPLLPNAPNPHDLNSAQTTRRKPPGQVIVLMIATALISLHSIMFEEVYALFAASSLKRGTGLSFQPRHIALSLGMLGPAAFITQLFLYPALNSRFDTIQLLKTSAVLFAVDYPLVSLLPSIHNPIARHGLLVVFLCIRVACVIIGWTSLNILTNHVVHPSRRGFMTGIVQAAASFSRAVGPAVGGALWSWSENSGLASPLDFHLFFLVISCLALLQYLTACKSPASAASKN